MSKERALQPEDIDSHIGALLKRTPAGPHFGMSTLTYCQDSIGTSLSKFNIVLARQYPPQAHEISQKLEQTKSVPVNMPNSDLTINDGFLYLRFPNNQMLPANYILQSVYSANPRLGAFEYAIALYPPTSLRYAAGRHPNFEMRYRNIFQTGELPLNHPYCETIAVAYITQIAKIKGIEAAKILLRKASSYSGLAAPEFINQNIASIGGQVQEVRKHSETVTEGLNTMKSLAEKHGIDAAQEQLLLDLAFIRNKGVDSQEEFSQFFKPIIRAVAKGDWQQTFINRDFLLEYFIASFPTWRQRELQITTGGPSFATMKDLVQATKTGVLVLSEKDVPDAYRQFFGEILTRKVERAKRLDEQDIMSNSVSLSNRILAKMADRKQYDLFIMQAPSDQIHIEVPAAICFGAKHVCTVYRQQKPRRLNFGILFHRYVSKLQESDKANTAMAEFAKQVQTTFEEERQQNPNLTYSLRDYLTAIIHSTQDHPKETDQTTLVWKKFTDLVAPYVSYK